MSDESQALAQPGTRDPFPRFAVFALGREGDWTQLLATTRRSEADDFHRSLRWAIPDVEAQIVALEPLEPPADGPAVRAWTEERRPTGEAD
jgi:hypothetical protein